MAEEETATVRVAEGLLRGRKEESSAGGAFWSFQGVPYAKPPVGPLRFKDAQPPEPWEGVRDAFKNGSCCTQFNMLNNSYEGSEDCLFLNVFTPQPPAPRDDPLPVVVYIHGGGFVSGSGDKVMAGPDYIVSENVIMVSINYRLGVLGFLFLEEAAPGNVGLKDQVASLRWIKKNIGAFGGDPGNVTIMGVSAGGASVHFHMLSPMSKGLFHRAIAMSGAALNPWAVQSEPAATACHLARLLGCTSDDPNTIVDFLRGVDHKELVRVANTDAVPEKDKKRIIKFSFVPTPERVVPGVETFLPAPVEKLMKEGGHSDVAYMTGVTKNEGLLTFIFQDIRKADVARKLDAEWEDNILTELRMPADENKIAAALEELRQFYMNGKPLSQDTFNGYIDMISDLTFTEGVLYALRCISKTSHSPLYQYVFTAEDELNFLRVFFKIDVPGTSHGDDMGYLLRLAVVPDVPEDSTAALTRRRMVRLLMNFVKTGDPTPEEDPLLGVRWRPYTEGERNFLDIGNQLQSGTNLFAERAAFWESFYEKYAS